MTFFRFTMSDIVYYFIGPKDPCKLYITGFGNDITEAELKAVLPKCVRVEIPRRKKGTIMG